MRTRERLAIDIEDHIAHEEEAVLPRGGVGNNPDHSMLRSLTSIPKPRSVRRTGTVRVNPLADAVPAPVQSPRVTA